ncbi:MAG: hypothetical protein H6705_02890 [Myxococcales bacterium]|nr:hypothetical protein [Myxococcales bacterium]
MPSGSEPSGPHARLGDEALDRPRLRVDVGEALLEEHAGRDEGRAGLGAQVGRRVEAAEVDHRRRAGGVRRAGRAAVGAGLAGVEVLGGGGAPARPAVVGVGVVGRGVEAQRGAGDRGEARRAVVDRVDHRRPAAQPDHLALVAEPHPAAEEQVGVEPAVDRRVLGQREQHEGARLDDEGVERRGVVAAVEDLAAVEGEAPIGRVVQLDPLRVGVGERVDRVVHDLADDHLARGRRAGEVDAAARVAAAAERGAVDALLFEGARRAVGGDAADALADRAHRDVALAARRQRRAGVAVTGARLGGQRPGLRRIEAIVGAVEVAPHPLAARERDPERERVLARRRDRHLADVLVVTRRRAFEIVPRGVRLGRRELPARVPRLGADRPPRRLHQQPVDRVDPGARVGEALDVHLPVGRERQIVEGRQLERRDVAAARRRAGVDADVGVEVADLPALAVHVVGAAARDRLDDAVPLDAAPGPADGVHRAVDVLGALDRHVGAEIGAGVDRRVGAQVGQRPVGRHVGRRRHVAPAVGRRPIAIDLGVVDPHVADPAVARVAVAVVTRRQTADRHQDHEPADPVPPVQRLHRLPFSSTRAVGRRVRPRLGADYGAGGRPESNDGCVTRGRGGDAMAGAPRPVAPGPALVSASAAPARQSFS